MTGTAIERKDDTPEICPLLRSKGWKSLDGDLFFFREVAKRWESLLLADEILAFAWGSIRLDLVGAVGSNSHLEKLNLANTKA
jgi:hypothetical protein